MDQSQIIRAVSVFAAVLHHKTFATTSGMSSFDVKPELIGTVLDTAANIKNYIVNGRR